MQYENALVAHTNERTHAQKKNIYLYMYVKTLCACVSVNCCLFACAGNIKRDKKVKLRKQIIVKDYNRQNM